MKYKLAVLSSCHKKDMLALAIISMGVLQDTLPILNLEALPTENILRDIANKAIWRTTKKLGLKVDPKLCRGDFIFVAILNYILIKLGNKGLMVQIYKHLYTDHFLSVRLHHCSMTHFYLVVTL